MTKTSSSLLWFVPPIVVIVTFFASLPWLADLDETVTLSIAGVASAFVVIWAHVVATRMERALDEVQLAGQRFAQAKGAAFARSSRSCCCSRRRWWNGSRTDSFA